MDENKKAIREIDKPSTRLLLLLIALIVIPTMYFMWWAPRQECANLVAYFPANDRSEEYYYIDNGRPGDAYSISNKYRTRGEALSSCLSSR